MNIQSLFNFCYKQRKTIGIFLLGLIFITTNFPLDMVDESYANVAHDSQQTVYFVKPQVKLLKLAFKYGSEVGYPETIEAILLQESNAGAAPLVGDINQPVGRRSYGRMQIKVAEARNVFNWYPELSKRYFDNRPSSRILDEEIIVLLITNDNANINIASKIFYVKIKQFKGNWAKAIASYNLGTYGASTITHHMKFPYVVDIDKKIHNIVRPFNKSIGLKCNNGLETQKIAEAHAQPIKIKKKLNRKVATL